MKRLSSIGYAVGALLLASGCLTGAGIISTFVLMYCGIGVIIIVLVVNVICQSKGGKNEESR